MQTETGCCRDTCGNTEVFDLRGPKTPHWITGHTATASGIVAVVSTAWSRRERQGRLRCRLSDSFRMDYKVEPGIYAAGSAGKQSPVLVTANYKLSFDLLRTELAGIDAWILVLDTRGINVWCAAGKGTFGTEELIQRIHDTGLSAIVEHRRLILPQLGAPGIQAHVVQELTGFSISYGPVYARDLPAYLRAGGKATADMRKVRFGLMERLELTPMEMAPALKGFAVFLAAVFIISGLQPEGILFRSVLRTGIPLAILGFASLLGGTLLTPILLPWIPSRSFAFKGLLVGGALTALLVFLTGSAAPASIYLVAFTLAFFPAASSCLALQFTGATPFTSVSGVKKELKVSLPLYIAAAAASLVLLVLFKLQEWGLGI